MFKTIRLIMKQEEEIENLRRALEKALSYKVDIKNILRQSDETKENYFKTIEKIKKRTGV